MQSKKIKVSTQKYLDIAEIKSDTIIMKDGTLRLVLLVSSVNFALKSEDEQNAIVSGYISFLNSFSFPIQIVIQSRKLNIGGYLDKLERVEKEQTNELLKVQMAEYRQFIVELVEMGDIMSKSFYLVVPYDPAADKKKGLLSKVGSVFSPSSLVRLEHEKFMKMRRELTLRAEHVLSGLQSMGVSAMVLDTQSLVELFYNSYNPVVSIKEKLPKIDKMQVEQ